MIREILFRGKRVTGSGFTYGSLVVDTATGRHYISSNHVYQNDIDVACTNVYEVIPATVGQLLHTEKNGRKWFKGDIAKMEATAHISGHPVTGNDEYLHYEYAGVVEMHIRHGLCIKVVKCIDVPTDEDVVFSKNMRKTITFERAILIGNIHDNPELIKQS